MLGLKLRDMCKDLLGTFLLSPVEVTFFPDKDGVFPLLVEEANVDVLVGVDVGLELGVEIWDVLVGVDVGLELVGVRIWDALDVGSKNFFFVFAALLSLFTGVTCPK